MNRNSENNEIIFSSESEPDESNKEDRIISLIQDIIDRLLSRFSNHPLRKTISMLENRASLNF